jgi:hypothetical protein
MKDNALHGVGIAVCDKAATVVVIPPHGAPRERSVVILPGETFVSTLEKVILPWVGFSTRAIGISYHNPDLIDEVTVPVGMELVAVSPTAATLAGYRLVGDKSRVLIQQGEVNDGSPEAFLKIGPNWTSWAVDGDLTTHRFVDASVIAGFSPRTREFANFVGAPANDSSIQLLGNWGWVNAARFIMATCAGLTPDPVTLTILNAVNDRKSRRTLVSRLCTLARNGDPFAVEVGRLMAQLIGRTIGYVADQDRFSMLSVQANSISAIDNMPLWMRGEGGLLSYLPSGTTTQFIGPRPQVLEAYGAIQLASRLALISA